MTEQEEKWLKEFDNKYFTGSTVKLDKRTGRYRPRLNYIDDQLAEKTCVTMNNMLDVWIAAKRSQPVVELPKPHSSDGFRYWHEDEIGDVLSFAGIQYKVKE